jgi:uncharacterized protein YggE
MKKYYYIVPMCLLALFCVGCSSTYHTQEVKEHNIVVSASQIEKVKPDLATIRYSVKTDAETVDTCQKNNSQDVNKIISAINALGIENKKISTDINLYPNYDYDNHKQLHNYTMVTDISINDIDVKDVNKVMQISLDNGINVIQNISYRSSESEKVYNLALQKAIVKAKAKADEIAKSTGKKIVDVMEVKEESNQQEYSLPDSVNMSAKATGAANSVNSMPGEKDVTASVSVTYIIS